MWAGLRGVWAVLRRGLGGPERGGGFWAELGGAVAGGGAERGGRVLGGAGREGAVPGGVAWQRGRTGLRGEAGSRRVWAGLGGSMRGGSYVGLTAWPPTGCVL